MHVTTAQLATLVISGVCCWAAITLAWAFRRISWVRLEERVKTPSRRAKVELCLEHERHILVVCAAVALLATVVLSPTVVKIMSANVVDLGIFNSAPFFGACAIAGGLVLLFGTVLPALTVFRGGETVLIIAAPFLAPAVQLGLSMGVLRPRLKESVAVRMTAVQQAAPLPAAGVTAPTADDLVAGEQDQARELLRIAGRLRTIAVAEVMTPRTDMTCVHAAQDLESARRLVVEQGHSRMPVWGEDRDDIVGILYAKDLLRYAATPEWSTVKIGDIMRPVRFVPESKRLIEMLEEFRARKVHISIVLDEYGGTAGVVTIDDIIKQIIGEVRDEYDQEEEAPPVHRKGSALEVDARVRLAHLNEVLLAELPREGDYETVGGYVLYKLGRIPQKGEEFTFDGVQFHVLAGDARKVSRLRVEKVGRPEP